MHSEQGLNPVTEFHIYKSHLPHWEDPGNVHFITFNTFDGYRLSDADKDIVFSSIKFHANKKYVLFSYVVMDTHVHVILQPLEAK